MHLNKPVVAIGAPARAWIGEVGNLLGTKVMVPENADVANAYGAAIGQVIEQEKTYMGTKLVITGIDSALPGSGIQ